MKKEISLLLTLILVFVCGFSACTIPAYANTRTKTRTINIVYDDSGSMAYKGVTSWSQAKYAMEVFAAMMDKNDSLNIYPMSSYSYKPDGAKSDSWGKTISISGADSAESRVKKIDQMNGDNGLYRNTPIQTVTAAGDALKKDSASEKWLIVLTDGEFDRGTAGSGIGSSETQSTITGYAGKDDINVAYVAIGSSALSLKSVSADGFYPFNADTNNILSMVTQVAKTVFNYQSIPVSGSGTYSFGADIPISKVIIFAQGSNASVEQVAIDGKAIEDKPTSVGVKVDKNTKYYPQNANYGIQFADGLVGQIVTYQSSKDDEPYADGNYSFKSNVDNIEVYFEPGVDIQPVLTSANGEEINLSQNGVESIEAGKKTVHIRVVNPLTGKTINPAESVLLDGAKLTVNITDSSGVSNSYSEGDEVILPEGTVEVYAKASFRGDIEKSSETKTLEVTPAKLHIEFSKQTYEIDLVTLKSEEDIEFTISSSDGTTFSADELASASFEISDDSGVNWRIESTDTPGRYRIVPPSEVAGIADISKDTLTVNGTIVAGGVKKKGTASITITGVANTDLELLLSLELPAENVGDINSEKHYMFDPAKRGVQENAAFILVKVEVKNPDGSTRALTEEEWNAGEKGFSFSSQSLETRFAWKLIGIICQQSLDFDIVKDVEISNYRVYLSGLTASGVRPNSSLVDTTLKIKLSNGVVEEGESEDTVSVKPLNMLSYVGRIFTIIGVILMAIIFVIMEIRKKKFDRDMYPNTTAILTKAGVSIKAPLPPQVSKKKIKFKIMPPWKAQERDITLKYPGYLDTPITFHCVATGDGAFVITNPKKFQIVKDQVRFDGAKYDAVIEHPIVLNLNSDIIVYVKKGNISGKLIMSFRKQSK